MQSGDMAFRGCRQVREPITENETQGRQPIEENQNYRSDDDPGYDAGVHTGRGVSRIEAGCTDGNEMLTEHNVEPRPYSNGRKEAER